MASKLDSELMLSLSPIIPAYVSLPHVFS